MKRRTLLRTGGCLTAAASALHVGIVVGGPAWYRFFGAGETMAQMAQRGARSPAVITLGIAAALAICTGYAFAGAGLIRPLPRLRAVLAAIAVVFFVRGLFGIPVVMLVDDPYLLALRARMPFMVVTSAICLVLGVCYASGVAADPRKTVPSSGGRHRSG